VAIRGVGILRDVVGTLEMVKRKPKRKTGPELAAERLSGAGLWVWYAEDLWLATAQSVGMTHVLVKSGDGANPWDQFSSELVRAVHDVGLYCHAWHYMEPGNVDGQIAAASRALDVGADGLIFDIEYEMIGRGGEVVEIVDRVCATHPDSLVGYCPDLRIAFGNNWPQGGFTPDREPFPWEYLNTLAACLPMLYYTDFHQPPDTTVQLADLWAKGCLERGWPVPSIFPVLPANSGAPALQLALQAATAYEYPGSSLWRWGTGTDEVYETIGGWYRG
jgi:hypothetical protein